MKIKIEVDIFDDPDFCNSESEICDYTSTFPMVCNFFKIDLKWNFKKGFAGFFIIEKCDKCKKAYQEQLKINLKRMSKAGLAGVEACRKFKETINK